MIDFSYDVQRIVINALKNSVDSVLVAQIAGKIYDYMPIQPKDAPLPYPFIMIGEIASDEWKGGGDCADGVVSMATVHVFSNHRGKEKILLIGKAVSEVVTAITTDDTMQIHNVKFLKSVYNYVNDDRLIHHGKIDFELTISN